MARNPKRKALYEVMGKGRLRPSAGKKLEPLRIDKSSKEEPAAITKSDTVVPERSAPWWRRPKLIRINADRLEISIPYQVAIALLLGLVALLLIVFRFGQFYQRAANSRTVIRKLEQENPAERPTGDTRPDPASSERLSPGEEKPEPAKPAGDHVIVLVQYTRRPDLVPVRQHFAQYGIETEIVQEGVWYFLITKDRYQNPANPGTDGYKAKQRIIEVGAEYKGKAPEGYETFAPHFFRDAYGKKVK